MLSAPFAGCKRGCFDFAQGLCSTLWVPKQLSAACVLYWCRKVLSFELPSSFMETPFWFLRSRISFLWRIWTEFTQIVFNNPILRKIWHSIKWHELSQFSLLLVAIQAVSVRFGIRGCAFFPAFLDLVVQMISWVIWLAQWDTLSLWSFFLILTLKVANECMQHMVIFSLCCLCGFISIYLSI